MDKQILEASQFNEMKHQLAQFAISDMAKAIIETRQPSNRFGTVERWLEETQEAVELLSSGQHVPFMGLARIRQLTVKIEKGMILEPGELVEYGDFLRSFRLIAKLFEKNKYHLPLLHSYTKDLADLSDIEGEISQKIQGNTVATDSTRPLRKIRGTIQKLEKDINERLMKYIRNSGSTNILQEKMILKKDERYTLPVRTEFKNKLKGNIIESSAKGSTVYIEPQDVAKLNDKLVMARSEEIAEVYQVLSFLTGLIAEKMEIIGYCKDVVVELDIIFARGKFSRSLGGKKPAINEEDTLVLDCVLHPLLGTDAVPLSLELGRQARGLIITGPNAGGKTVVLKTVALTCLLTMSGIFVSCKEGTSIAVFDEIFIDIGDQQSLENSLSTFSGHMQNISGILRQTKAHSLILLDEIGSGTEPNEGAALGISIMEEMYRKGALVIATTHYGEIKDFALRHEDFLTAAMAFDAETLTPKYKLLMGQVGNSNAFWIAKKMNIQRNVLERATQYLAQKEYAHEKLDFGTKKAKEKIETPQLFHFSKGDRVFSKELEKTGLYHEDLDENFGEIFADDKFHKVMKKRLELQAKASDLYPDGYDLDTLFEDFATRKARRDLERGSKKAQKKLDKDRKERQQIR